jgi:hypothetical protein
MVSAGGDSLGGGMKISRLGSPITPTVALLSRDPKRAGHGRVPTPPWNHNRATPSSGSASATESSPAPAVRSAGQDVAIAAAKAA